MPVTRRTQVLMDPEDYRQLRNVARRKKTSVGELIRTAVRAAYLEPAQPDRKPIVEAILQMRLPAISWSRARKEIAASHAGLP
jgi:hypothetical protein